MKAYAIKEPGKIIEKETGEPVLKSNEVLIEIVYLGLCGSDLSAYRGQMPLFSYPRIPGHEISGRVVDKGAYVPDLFTVGDKVTVLPYTSCGVCPACRNGRENTCEFNETLGVQRDGALTPYIAVPYEKVFSSKILSLKELVLTEPMSVGYHGANRGRISETDTVAIIGCGTIGMGALCAAVRKGAEVIAIDINDIKLKKAQQFGAGYVINSAKEDVRERILKLTNKEGVSVAIEAVGHPEAFELAIELVAFSGRVVSIGYSKKDVEFNTRLIVRKELDVLGSRNALRVFPAVIGMLEKREMPYTEMITKVFPFGESADAFEYWDKNSGTVSKILIEMKA